MEPWHREIIELHEFFEGYYLGAIDADDVGRLEVALAPDFTIIGPGGGESSRDQTVEAIRSGHAHTPQFRISIADARLLLDLPDLLVARYVEHQEVAGAITDRLSTVVFTRAPDAPNGLRWRTVHETWLSVDRIGDTQ
jgi:hypothetical protein